MYCVIKHDPIFKDSKKINSLTTYSIFGISCILKETTFDSSLFLHFSVLACFLNLLNLPGLFNCHYTDM